MKATIRTQDIDFAKKIMEDAMLKALLNLGKTTNELSFFCTIEENEATFEKVKAA